MRHFDATFWWNILKRHFDETFWNVLTRHFDDTFIQDILMIHLDETFWWDILIRYFDETFLRDICWPLNCELPLGTTIDFLFYFSYKIITRRTLTYSPLFRMGPLEIHNIIGQHSHSVWILTKCVDNTRNHLFRAQRATWNRAQWGWTDEASRRRGVV